MPSTGLSFSVTTANGYTTTLSGDILRSLDTGTLTTGDDTFKLDGLAAEVTLGAGNQTLKFGGIAEHVTGGAGDDTIVATGGANIFTVGTGSMTVTGGLGPDIYAIHAGSGQMTINDFDAAKGDALKIDEGLKASMHTDPDGHGGTVLTFTGGTSVDLKGLAAAPTNSTFWAA